jgi:hypothetical protein
MGEMMATYIRRGKEETCMPTSNVHLLLMSSVDPAGRTKRIAHNQNLISYDSRSRSLVQGMIEKVRSQLFIVRINNIGEPGNV